MKKIDLSGQRFGKLLVLAESGANRHGNTTWECRCDCGSTIVASGVNLRSGNSASCGCSRRNACAKRLTTHGASKHPEYSVWNGMIRRCEDPRRDDYHRYGGRGISVCDRWRHGEHGQHAFLCFLEDMGPRPSSLHSIERNNGLGNYEPGNCVWATSTEQANNRSSNRRITVGSRTQTLAEWVRETGGDYHAIKKAIVKGAAPGVALGISA